VSNENRIQKRRNDESIRLCAAGRLCAPHRPGDPLLFHLQLHRRADRGYEEPCALLTKEAARALKGVSNELFVQGYRLRVFDAYRPACAVKQLVLRGIEDQDIRMKPYFYPEFEKQELFARGWIAKQSSHSRGTAIDLTLLDMKAGKELDMGSPFDLFSGLSHPNCRGVTEVQYENRMLLQHVMVRNGFCPIDFEWWHFCLENEPYPDTYFNFPTFSE